MIRSSRKEPFQGFFPGVYWLYFSGQVKKAMVIIAVTAELLCKTAVFFISIIFGSTVGWCEEALVSDNILQLGCFF